MSYFLVPNLRTLREEFDQRWPRRDRTSDGWVGDLAHQQRPSGHNPDESGNAERQDGDNLDEVRALDLDKDVDGAAGDELFAELDRVRRTPALRRRLVYIIYRRQIASASNGWVWRPYSGDNPHTEHGHLSGHPDYDNSTAPWGVAQEDDMTRDEFIAHMRAAVSDPAVRDVLRRAGWEFKPADHGGKTTAHAIVLNGLPAAMAALAARPAAVIDYDQLADAIVRRAIGVDQA